MKIHANARTTVKTRAALVEAVVHRKRTKAEAARAFGTSATTVAKWVKRYLREGPEGLRDRSSAPHQIPHRTPEARARRIAKLRHKGLCAWQIAERLRMAISTVTAVLRRLGLGRGWNRKRPEVVRYEWPKPGDLLHVDMKKLGKFREVGHRITGKPTDRSRGMGWEFVYVCVDDASRLSYVEVLENELAVTATGFLDRALRWFKRRGVRARRVMTDNGAEFTAKKVQEWIEKRGIGARFIEPGSPWQNGHNESFNAVFRDGCLNRWLFESLREAREASEFWLAEYNEERPHGSLGGLAPSEFFEQGKEQEREAA